MALNGSLDDYSPAGALRVLSSTSSTGAVRFTGSAGCTVYLCEGQLYFARGEETDDALATALVRPGRLTAEAWTRAVEQAGDAPQVGELLISNGDIDPDLLASVVLSVIYDPLITLFREGDGAFDFEPDTMHWIGPYRGFNVEAIVNEVRRRVRNADEMSDVVPSTTAWVSACRTLPEGAAQVTLLREDWELVTSLSGPRTIRELAGSMGRGQYSTAQVVHRLARAGLLEVIAEPFGPLDRDPVHEPSAAERLAAAAAEGAGTAETAPDEGEPDDLPDAPADDGGEDVPSPDPPWSSTWTAGNPFEHPVPEPGPDRDGGITFGGTLAGPAGPETAPDDESQFLPRRTSVQEADPDDRNGDGGLAGIAGFRDPNGAAHRQDTALADATSGQSDLDPNAAWLENLYAQFIDEASDAGTRTRKKEALDVAFQSPDEAAASERTGTLRRLVDALRRL